MKCCLNDLLFLRNENKFWKRKKEWGVCEKKYKDEVEKKGEKKQNKK